DRDRAEHPHGRGGVWGRLSAHGATPRYRGETRRRGRRGSPHGTGPAYAMLTWLAPMFTWRAGRAILRTRAKVARAERNRLWADSILRSWNSAWRIVRSFDWLYTVS